MNICTFLLYSGAFLEAENCSFHGVANLADFQEPRGTHQI